ncbi:cobalamin biosynthesis protein [Kitasatospora sp. NPDC050463]|uniref:cobalamin biosynthesis protein n=1 Tax=Kitasatospora sp. NPDC050463 TaxID=3155786 RepID=UPI0033F3CBCC
MIGLLVLDAAGHPLAEELHALWPDGSRVFRAEDDGDSGDGDGDGPGELLERALGDCRQLVCFAPVASIVRLLLLRHSPADPGRSGDAGGLGGTGVSGGVGHPGGVGVVCIDPERRFAVSLTGHGTGADELAGEVSALLGTCPVVTGGHVPSPNSAGRPAGIARYGVSGRDEDVPVRPPSGSHSDTLRPGAEAGGALVVGALVVGVGLREAAAPPEVARLIRRALREAGLADGSVARLATLTGKGDHPAVRRAAARLGVPVDEHTVEALSAVVVPNPSAAVGAAVGTLSVAEAAALASAPGGELVVPKQKSATVTVAVARAAVAGRLAVVGLGPGQRDLVVPRAEAELRRASVAVGTADALAAAAGLLRPGTRRLSAPDCLRAAVELASCGEAVALVALGDGLAYAPPASDRYALVRVPGLSLLADVAGDHS